ncbi:hypothetical protein [Rhodococcus aetherivorans]|uniref:hypothetical protein n=1 Tax=Rhodococcus aetherivorans TaxID=191292 RepID=UPI001E3E6D62|nr:hypothetical protein [Rhodococcus aetherivorans]UGQ39378.1 hypothetical protein LRQ66_14270 [Rhodococcus aetherivorans]
MARKSNWKWGAGVVVALVLFGSCSDDDNDTDSTKSINATTTVRLQDQPVWTGTVVAHDMPSRTPLIRVNLGNGREEKVLLAHVEAVACGDLSQSEAAKADAIARLNRLAPVGSAITIVRGTKQSATSTELDSYAFVHLDAASTATVAPTTTTPITPTPTATTTAPKSKSAPGTSTTTTPAPTTTGATPSEGASLNEVLLAEGLATITDPDINLSVLAEKTVSEQQYGAYNSVRSGPNATYFPTLLSAYQAAWDGRIGYQAVCRQEDDKRIIDKNRWDELDRIRRGPDGEFGTSDDDRSNWKFDENGNLYVDTSVSSGGGSIGGGGGGGGRCRGRWC